MVHKLQVRYVYPFCRNSASRPRFLRRVAIASKHLSAVDKKWWDFL
ncbi:MAG: hypothetical protein QW348_08210 [Ignisphaera sp.]